MAPKSKTRLPEFLDEREPNRFLPGWLVSLAVHFVFFGAFVVGSHRQGVPEGSGEAFHDVGLFDKQNLPAATTAEPVGDSLEATPSVAAVDEPLIAEQPAQTESAIPLQLPQTTTIGSGPALPMKLPAAMSGGVKAIGKGGQVRGGGGALGPRFGRSDGTSFFQVAAQGDHFYYVVDCSGSMDDNNAIGVARAELMASIERLDPAKQFQVLFYNSDLHPMLKGKQEIFFATDINRTFARQFINSQQPDSGTMHRPALMAALRCAPNVIFFLTDGDEPELSHRDLHDLKAANRRNTTIHVIQFGTGPKLGPMNWLEQLAKDHQGTYRYRDVATFRH